TKVGLEDKIAIEVLVRSLPTPSGTHADFLFQEQALPAEDEIGMAYAAYRGEAVADDGSHSVPAQAHGKRFKDAWSRVRAVKPQHQRAFIDSVAAPCRPVEGTGVVRLAELIKLAGMQPFPIDRELINYPDAAIRLAGLIDLELGAAEKVEPAGADDATSKTP